MAIMYKLARSIVLSGVCDAQFCFVGESWCITIETDFTIKFVKISNKLFSITKLLSPQIKGDPDDTNVSSAYPYSTSISELVMLKEIIVDYLFLFL